MNCNYKISLEYDDFFANSNQITSKEIEIVGDSLTFKTNKDSINYLDKNNIRYMLHTSYKAKLNLFIKYKFGMVIGLMMVFIMIFLNSFRVSKIDFNGDYPINKEVETYISGQTKKVLFFSFHNGNYEELSKDLRSIFNEYEWINVEKVGSVLKVEIEPTTTKDIPYENEVVGNIVARGRGIIEEFIIFNGVGNVNVGDYFEDGTVLIDGISHNKEAKGYVLAKTFETQKITVNKKITKEEYSGNVNNFYDIGLFGIHFKLFNDNPYPKSDLQNKKVFNIPFIIEINKIEEYEKDDIIYIYDKESAILYAKSVIENDFSKGKVLNEEKIIRLQELVVEELEDSFVITFLVKKLESIGEFVKKA